MIPRNQKALSIHGPDDAIQFVPSFYSQFTRFASERGAKSDRSIFRAFKNNGALRTIGGQTPVTRGIDLRSVGTLPSPYVEPERFRSISLHDAVLADR